jgi:hypothetical protein
VSARVQLTCSGGGGGRKQVKGGGGRTGWTRGTGANSGLKLLIICVYHQLGGETHFASTTFDTNRLKRGS